MDTGIIISLIFGICSVISAYLYGYLPARRKEMIERQNVKILKLYKDIDIFNEVEDLLLDELSNVTSENKESAKRRIRKVISERKGYALSDLRKPSIVKGEIERYSNL